MANRNSSTMELDSILAEARSRKNPSAQKAPSRGGAARPAASPRQSAPSGGRSLNDDFILTDDNRRPVKSQQYQQAKGGPRPAASVKPQPKKKKKKKTGLIVALCIIAIVLVAAAGGLTLYLNSGSGTGPESTFSDNVYINGKPLKDLTMEQARALTKTIESDLADGIKVEVKAGDKTYNYTKDDFKYSFNTDTVLNEAKTYSEEKGIKTEQKDYEIKMTVEDTTCSDIISKIASDVKTDAQDARVSAFDPDADSMFTFTDEQKGVSLDEETSLSALKTFIDSGSISGSVDATLKEVEPDITASYLKENITKLSSYSTISTNNSNGNENMRLSLSKCNGSIIDPGETWSFNECTGDSNQESNGYKPAGVLIQGRSETGVGGGICQSSTTIYNACLLCGMDVVERQPHYYKSTYVDAGRDATVDYPRIDLKMMNPFKYQLFMKCWMDGTELNCEMYGLENPKFDDVEITTGSPNYFSGGYTVYAERTYYKDGEEVGSDDLPKSDYYTSAPSSGSSGGSGGSSYDDDDDDSGSGDSGGGESGGGESGGGESGGGESGGGESGGGESGGGESGGGESGGGNSGGGESGGGE